MISADGQIKCAFQNPSNVQAPTATNFGLSRRYADKWGPIFGRSAPGLLFSMCLHLQDNQNPKPENLNPKPQTPTPKPKTLNPKPYTLNLKP